MAYLKRELGLFDVVNLVIGTIVGLINVFNKENQFMDKLIMKDFY